MGYVILFIGPAGCGKTSLTAALGSWLNERGISVAYVNLDAGALDLPYEPNVDVRRRFTLESIMREEGLGPNGAMIKAADYLVEIADELAEEVNGLNIELALIDTPGQMEVFVFRPSGPALVKALLKAGSRTVALNMLDATITSTATDLVVAALLSATIRLRLEVPTVPVVNKVDVTRPSIEREELINHVKAEEYGILSDFVSSLAKALDVIEIREPILVSAKKGLGLDILYDRLMEVFCECGED